MSSEEKEAFLKACKKGDVALLSDMLLKNKNLIHSRDDWNQNTPLHIAILYGRTNAVRFVLDEKAEVNSKNKFGSTPGHLAASNGYVDVLRLLMSHGAVLSSTDEAGETAVHAAALEGNINVLMYLQEIGQDLGAANNAGETAVHAAARGGDVNVLRYLQEIGQDLGAANNVGNTAIHVAAHAGNADVIRYLREVGQDLEAANYKVETPLHWACEYGQTQVVIFLLENGCSLHTKNKRGVTPMNVLEQNIGNPSWKKERAECLKQVQSYFSSRESIDDPQAEPTGQSGDIGDISDKDKQSAVKKEASLSETDKDMSVPLQPKVASDDEHSMSSRDSLEQSQGSSSSDSEKQEKNSLYTDVCSSESILLKTPKLKDVHDLTISQSSRWNDLGRELELLPDFRKQLRKDTTSSDEDRLEEVLQKWIESESVPVTWSTLIEALEAIELKEVANHVKDFLKTSKAKKLYK